VPGLPPKSTPMHTISYHVIPYHMNCYMSNCRMSSQKTQKTKVTKAEQFKAKLTPEQIRVYRKHFEMFDLNGDGVISARELRKVSKQMGYQLDEEQIEVGYHPPHNCTR